MTPDPWDAVTAARLPAVGLGVLAGVRDRPGVRVHAVGDAAWVTWPAGSTDVVRVLRPARGVEFFAERDGAWYRFSSRVPTADHPPPGPGRPLDAVIVPARVTPTSPDAAPLEPARVGVVRGGAVRPATALRCRLPELVKWADGATTDELHAVRAARREDDVLLCGDALPSIPGAVRYWGATLLVPLGFRPDPDLPQDMLRAAAGAGPGELLILVETGADVVPESALTPLTRAGARLAAQNDDRP